MWLQSLHNTFSVFQRKGSGGLSRLDLFLDLFIFPTFIEVKIGGRSQLKGEFIILVPVRMSSLIRAAPEIPLTPISYYQSWKCSGPHLTLLFEQQSGAFWFVMPVIHGKWWFDDGTLMWWGRVIASTVYTKRTVWCGSLTWWRATV